MSLTEKDIAHVASLRNSIASAKSDIEEIKSLSSSNTAFDDIDQESQIDNLEQLIVSYEQEIHDLTVVPCNIAIIQLGIQCEGAEIVYHEIKVEHREETYPLSAGMKVVYKDKKIILLSEFKHICPMECINNAHNMGFDPIAISAKIIEVYAGFYNIE